MSMSTPAERSIERILLVSLDNLGDLVFASSLVPPLLERFPHATLDVWCKAYTEDIGWLLPRVHDVVAADPFWDRAPGRGKGALWPFVRSVAAVRGRRHDLAVLAAAPWRTAAAVAATGIPMRIGFVRRRNARFLTHRIAAENIQKPVLEEMARLLAPLGIDAAGLRYRLDAARLGARVERLARRLTTPFAALHPFASKRERCVPLSEWLAVARTFAERGLPPLWIGSAREMEEVRGAGRAPGWHYLDEIGDGTLADTAAALSMARAFAGHDSGPLHVAGALGVPVLGIFAPGEPLRTFPQGVGASRMIARGSPGEISGAEMVAALEELLGSDSRGVIGRA